jgi:hypothetical protein
MPRKEHLRGRDRARFDVGIEAANDARMSRRITAKKAPLMIFLGLALAGSVVAAEARVDRPSQQTIEQRLRDPVSRPDPKDMRTRPMGDWVIVAQDVG